MMPIARIRAVVCMCVAVILLVTSVGGGLAAASEADGRFIVIYLPGTDLNKQKQLIEALLGPLGVDVIHVLTLIDALAIKIPIGLVDYVLGLLDPLNLGLLNTINDKVVAIHDDIVGSATEVTPMTMAEVSADPSAREGYDWGALRIGADTVEQTGSGVMVAILDSGIDCTHPELHDNIVSDQKFSAVPKTDGCVDDNGHGTHVAGSAAARENGLGIIGVAPEANLVPVKVLDRNARGWSSDVIAGLQYVYNKGFRVVNMSFGFYEASVPLEKAIKRLYNRGMVMVASAGNCGWSDGGGDGGGDPPNACPNPSQLSITYPAAYADEVIAVAATTSDNQVAYYSRFGSAMDVAAPGDGIISAAPGGGYAQKSGTSMAAAHVSGAVTLLLQRNPKLSRAQVVDLLEGTANPLPGYSPDQQGAGLIDVEGMLQALQ